MPEPESHTLRLLREIRGQGEDARKELDRLHSEFDALRKEAAEGFQHLGERIEHLTRLANGESVLGRYAAANVDQRLDAIERRVSALEEGR